MSKALHVVLGSENAMFTPKLSTTRNKFANRSAKIFIDNLRKEPYCHKKSLAYQTGRMCY